MPAHHVRKTRPRRLALDRDSGAKKRIKDPVSAWRNGRSATKKLFSASSRTPFDESSMYDAETNPARSATGLANGSEPAFQPARKNASAASISARSAPRASATTNSSSFRPERVAGFLLKLPRPCSRRRRR